MHDYGVLFYYVCTSLIVMHALITFSVLTTASVRLLLVV